jgi:manganese-transporting P-type ATPase
MSIIAQVNDQSGSRQMILSKGAPEILSKHLKDKPADYTQTYLHHVKEGSRVLALAYKNVPKMGMEKINGFSREEAECDLTFCGFIVAECPLKEDTFDIIKELKFSSHEVKMITGDNALTAAFIGQKLEFGVGKSLFANDYQTEGKLVWYDIDDKRVCETSNEEQLTKLYKTNLLCISGDILAKVILMKDNTQCAKIMKHIHLFARTSPS